MVTPDAHSSCAGRRLAETDDVEDDAAGNPGGETDRKIEARLLLGHLDHLPALAETDVALPVAELVPNLSPEELHEEAALRPESGDLAALLVGLLFELTDPRLEFGVTTRLLDDVPELAQDGGGVLAPQGGDLIVDPRGEPVEGNRRLAGLSDDHLTLFEWGEVRRKRLVLLRQLGELIIDPPDQAAVQKHWIHSSFSPLLCFCAQPHAKHLLEKDNNRS